MLQCAHIRKWKRLQKKCTLCDLFNAVQMCERPRETGDDSIRMGLHTDGKGLEPIFCITAGAISFSYELGKRFGVNLDIHFCNVKSSETSMGSSCHHGLMCGRHMYFNSMPHGKITSSSECVHAIFLGGYHCSDFLITAITYSPREMSSAFKGI